MPKMQRFLICFALFLGIGVLAQKNQEYFLFDSPDEEVKTTLLENPLFYDAGIASASNGLWVAWLEFVPEKGDQLWLGLRKNEKWVSKTLLSKTQGDFANPTPTIDAEGRLWLSHETAKGSNWNVVVQNLKEIANGEFDIASVEFEGINHSVTPLRDGKLLVAWQKEVNGSFQVRGEEISYADKKFSIHGLADVPKRGNAWHPSTASSGKSSYLGWDSYDGRSYNVFLRKDSQPPLTIAATPAFEAHVTIASGKNENLWIAWEEDGENWGKVFLSKEPGDERKRYRMTDKHGPLHRFRKLHFAEWNEVLKAFKTIELPQPSFQLARSRTNAPDGLKDVGVFYERAQLAVDGLNRPWIVYRHSFASYIGILPESHKHENMRIYARCLLPDGWSKLHGFDLGQGDGMQRVSVTPLEEGIAVAYTTGRTDRRKIEPEKRGVALAEIRLPENEKAKLPAKIALRPLQTVSGKIPTPGPERPATEVGGKKYELFFGDLHRHTDISLCFSPVDGTIDDAYRYAIDAAPLDFLGITDHTHDLDIGNPLALIWHRSRKEVNRHALAGKFIPFYSYERSRGDTDHNVISLRDDILHPHTYPLPQFWKELDNDTFTIPHQPVNGLTWKNKDDAHRPLIEMFQGFRNFAVEEDAKQGLLGGHRIGFIGSSDHLSTSASYAGVWAENPTRESLFRAMQSRRTFAATAKIKMKVTCGDYWMGERFETKVMSPLRIEVTPTAPIKELQVFVDAEPVSKGLSNETKGVYTFAPHESLTGPHIFHVRVTQEDGDRAWSSPIWVDIKK